MLIIQKRVIYKLYKSYKNALDNNQIVPFFQGIYNNKGSEITKYEALARIVLEDRVISLMNF